MKITVVNIGDIKNMNEQRSKGGRPKVDTAPVMLRMPVDLLGRLDRWIEQQPVQPTRPGAIRELVTGVLDQQMLAAIDEWRRQQTPPPPMADAISAILKDWLATHGLLDSEKG